jgi:hypothetical protein
LGVISRDAAFTSAMILRASAVAGRIGRPLALPLCPRFHEVDLRPPFGIAWFRLFLCLFPQQPVFGPSRSTITYDAP